MRHLKKYQDFNINEKENTSYSPLSAYKAIALGVSRAFNLLGYFYSIAKKDADPKEWKSQMSEISSEMDPKKKWDKIIKVAESIQADIEEYARGRRMDKINLGRFFDVGVNSKSIPVALEKFKVASEILTEELPPRKIRERLQLINQSLPLEPFKLDESLILERDSSKRTPSESELLFLADSLSSSITRALSISRNMKQLFPDAEAYLDNVISRYITPASEKIKKILSTAPPSSSLDLSKSVKKSYKRDGWVVNSVQDKYIVDQYNDLLELQDDIKIGIEKLNQGKENIIKELAPSTDAKEFIDAGNRILDTVENTIAEVERVEDLRRRSNLMIPVAHDEPVPTPKAESPVRKKELVSTDELRQLLKRRLNYQ